MSGSADTRYPSPPPPEYDERYLAGVGRFNRGDYFDAHEVWEELWMDCPAADRRFYQSLIQAAVALYHWGNGNRAGAARLFHSGRRYMAPYRPTHRGLDVDRFWRDVETVLAPALAGGEPNPPAPSPEKEGGERHGPSSSPPFSREGSGEGFRNLPHIALTPPPARRPGPPDSPRAPGATHE